jgi:hypothetical protein
MVLEWGHFLRDQGRADAHGADRGPRRGDCRLQKRREPGVCVCVCVCVCACFSALSFVAHLGALADLSDSETNRA